MSVPQITRGQCCPDARTATTNGEMLCYLNLGQTFKFLRSSTIQHLDVVYICCTTLSHLHWTVNPGIPYPTYWERDPESQVSDFPNRKCLDCVLLINNDTTDLILEKIFLLFFFSWPNELSFAFFWSNHFYVLAN